MIKLIVVGKLREKGLKLLVDEYLKRLQGYTKLEIIELKDLKIPVNSNSTIELKIIEDEGNTILNKIAKDDNVILLDLHGKELGSVEMAAVFENYRISSRKNLDIVIGGSLGVSDKLRKRADLCWKLSSLTFTHQFTRVIVLEQIYRFFKINNNETYHK
jgi:23S rRNA (pseudouridine1915-N3)-methyltransferase